MHEKHEAAAVPVEQKEPWRKMSTTNGCWFLLPPATWTLVPSCFFPLRIMHHLFIQLSTNTGCRAQLRARLESHVLGERKRGKRGKHTTGKRKCVCVCMWSLLHTISVHLPVCISSHLFVSLAGLCRAALCRCFVLIQRRGRNAVQFV